MNKLYFFLILFSLSACYSLKKVTYIQTEEDVFTVPINPVIYLVQPNDILNIKVQSRDAEQSSYFNISTESRNIQANPASLFLSGYSVNQDGQINLPIVGEIKVSGLSIEQIRELIQSEINRYLLDAIVLVKLTSFKISVLGDVKNPGTNYVYNNQATIFEALSAAGDANLSANHTNVKLMRQIDGESRVIKLDLTDPKIIGSPYYFLMPNDVIYVETSKENIVRHNLVLFTVIFTAISTSLLILSFIQTN
jgi:polysaccharide export outer membrane protein